MHFLSDEPNTRTSEPNSRKSKTTKEQERPKSEQCPPNGGVDRQQPQTVTGVVRLLNATRILSVSLGSPLRGSLSLFTLYQMEEGVVMADASVEVLHELVCGKPQPLSSLSQEGSSFSKSGTGGACC